MSAATTASSDELAPSADTEAKLKRVHCLPSKRLLVLIGLATLPMVLSPLWFDIVWIVVGFDAVLVLGMLLDFSLLSRRARVRVQRKRDPRLSVGADNPVRLTIENLGSEHVRAWVRDAYPPEFEAAGDDIGTNDEVTRGHKMRPRIGGIAQAHHHRPDDPVDLDVRAEEEQERGARGLRRRLTAELTPGGSVGPGLELPPQSRQRVTYLVTPTRRGDYDFGDIWVRLESRLSLATLVGVQPAAESVKVYPNVRNVKNLGVATKLSDAFRLGLKKVRLEGGGGEFAKLRDYVQGDSYRDIHWKATARRRSPITQVYETERSQNVIIAIDAGRLMATQLGNLSKLDHAINAALLLAYSALGGGDRVGLVVFDDQVRTFVPPSKGRGQYRLLLESLYGVEPQLCQVNYQELITFLLGRVRRRSLVALFTDLHDEATNRPLVDYTRFLMPRHLPLCITLSDTNLAETCAQVPADEGAFYERAVALELSRQRELLKGELARLGAHVLDRPADRIAVDTINRYVELKQRRLL